MGRLPHPGRPARRFLGNAAAAALAAVLGTVVFAPAAPAAARIVARLAATVHVLGLSADQVPATARQGVIAPVPASVPARATAAVGALFTTAGGQATTSGGQRLASHFCTASVVDSPAGDVVMTAAHCVSGRAPGQFVFVPGFHDGQAPYGVWSVTRVIVGQAWTAAADPEDDVALLLVARPGTAAAVQRLTGGERLGIAQPAGQLVQVTGYPDDAAAPISCLNRAVPFSPGDLEFDCGGYTDGTSGSPLVARVNPVTGLGTVIGVIGGYQRGGVTASVSYADQLGTGLATLYREATARS